MDKQTILWITAAVARLVVGAIAGHVGWDLSQQQANIGMLTEGFAAFVMVGVSIYTSVKGRQAIAAK